NRIHDIGNTGKEYPPQEQRRNKLDYKSISQGYLYIGPAVYLPPTFLHSKTPSKQNHLKKRKCHLTYRPGPKIIIVEHSLIVEENRGQAQDKCQSPKGPSALVPVPTKL